MIRYLLGKKNASKNNESKLKGMKTPFRGFMPFVVRFVSAKSAILIELFPLSVL